MIRTIPQWVVVYKVRPDDNWQVRINLAGPGHASDVVGQMKAEGYLEAIPVCGQLGVDIPGGEPEVAAEDAKDGDKGNNS